MAQKAFLKSLFWTPSIAVIIEPTASLVASLLPGETTVSPSRKAKPFSGNDLLTRSIYSEECVLIKKDWSNLVGFFHIKFLLSNLLKYQ